MIRFSIRYLLFSLIIIASWASSENEDTYTNDWLVRIEGGRSVADVIAKRHGFINRGQINDMDEWYHFEHVTSPRRSKRSLTLTHHTLSSESAILHVEQQVVKSRVKRENFHLPTDPFWNAQWYLNTQSHGSDKNKDMNVERVWEQGITGKGVAVTILDDGLERNNPDLKENYDPEASYDFNDHDDDPNPRYDPTNENKHGTRCAGEVASVKNDVCAVGVAYEASIGGVRMLDGDVTDVVEGNSLSFHKQHVDVYSSSWGPDDDGVTVDGPGTLAKHAFLDGITKGRNGLGSIFMWASGNGGYNGDSCSCDGYVISIYTIAIGAVGEHGDKPWYSEECPAMMAVTYSSGSSSEAQIVSSDLRNSCTRRHTGTSASAPLAAGIVALALQANSKLTWRDVQHIIVLTSRPEPMKSRQSSDWTVNGAGRDVSHLYGFGLIDATAMVSRARHWETVPKQISCTLPYDSSHKSGNTYSVRVSQSNCGIKYLEHVQAVVSIQVVGRRGAVSVQLTSPSGYTSHLLQHRSRDYRSTDFHDWPFMSVHHWGEQPDGTWTLKIDSSSSHLSSVRLVLYGTSQQPASVSRIPRSCDPSCRGGCASEGADFCDECVNLQMSLSLACVDKCPEGTYQNLHMCRNCPSNCVNCTDESTCLQCQDNYITTSSGACRQSCPPQTYLNKNTASCDLCDTSCHECSGPNSVDCTSCSIHYSLQGGQCILNTTCPMGHFFKLLDMVCVLCHESCAECNDTGPSDCTACPPDHVLNGTECVAEGNCPPGMYYDGSCVPCIDNCQSCDNSLTCRSCSDGSFLYTEKLRDGEISRCLSTCPDNWFASVSDGMCAECHESCFTCNGPGADNCVTCHKNDSQANSGRCWTNCDLGLYYNTKTSLCEPCLESCAVCSSPDDCSVCRPGLYLLPNTGVCSVKCTPGYYRDNDTTRCLPCDERCVTCDGGESNNCLTCPEHMLLHKGVCVSDCPDRTYHDRITPLCGSCHPSCLTCLGPNETECLSCASPLIFDANRCVKECPARSVKHNGQCEACSVYCSECTTPSKCDKCSKGYYRSHESCVAKCPKGEYGEGGVCKACIDQCADCSTFDNCRSCNVHYRLSTHTGMCQPCCIDGGNKDDCCDCSANATHCVPSTHSSDSSEQRPVAANRPLLGFLVLAVIVVFVVLVGSVVFFIYRRRANKTRYHMLMPRSGDGLPSIGSDTEDELFSKS